MHRLTKVVPGDPDVLGLDLIEVRLPPARIDADPVLAAFRDVAG